MEIWHYNYYEALAGRQQLEILQGSLGEDQSKGLARPPVSFLLGGEGACSLGHFKVSGQKNLGGQTTWISGDATERVSNTETP